jgi:NADH:ubiquinone oxidoreductase subunit 5 (subunit L)/multisubunit Na+/H+ antiporter MnhA subunit
MRREISLSLLRLAQLLAWVTSVALLLKTMAGSAPSFTNLAILSIYAFAFISTIHLLFEPNRPSHTVLLQVQFSAFAALLICYSENIFGIGAGLVCYSVLSWLDYSSESHKRVVGKLFRSQIVADLCIIFGLLILTISIGMTFTTETKWIFLAEILFFTGILTKIVSFITGTGTHPSSSVFTHKGLFIIATILLGRDTSFLTSEYYNIVLLCLSNAGIVWFNIDALLTPNIRKSAMLLNFGVTSFILFLHCLCNVGITKYVFLAYFFIQGSILLLVEIVIRIMSGELDINRMGDIRKHVFRTFTITVLMFAGAISMMLGNKILLPLLNVTSRVHDNVFTTFAIASYAFFFITYCIWMIRFVLLVFLGKNRSSEQVFAHIKEVHWGMSIPVIACFLCGSILLTKNLSFNAEFTQSMTLNKIVTPATNQIFFSGMCSLGVMAVHMLNRRHVLAATTLLGSELFDNLKSMLAGFSDVYRHNHLKHIASFILKTFSELSRNAQLFFLEKLCATRQTTTIISLLGILILLLCLETLSSI